MKTLRHILTRPPVWVVTVCGCLVGISLLALILRQASVTGEGTSLGMFALIHFSGYLFFIISPVEILYIHMLGEPHSLLALFILAVATAFAAQGLDYAIGYAFSSTVIENIIGPKKYRRYYEGIDRYGGTTIFLFSFFPLPSPIVMLVAGMIRYPWGWAAVLSLAGLTFKYLTLAIIVQRSTLLASLIP